MNITRVSGLFLRLPQSRSGAIAHGTQPRGRKVCNHNFTTDINTAASLHFLCAIEHAYTKEYSSEPGETCRNLARRPIGMEHRFMHLPEEPGLGVEPNEEIIAKYLCR